MPCSCGTCAASGQCRPLKQQDQSVQWPSQQEGTRWVDFLILPAVGCCWISLRCPAMFSTRSTTDSICTQADSSRVSAVQQGRRRSNMRTTACSICFQFGVSIAAYYLRAGPVYSDCAVCWSHQLIVMYCTAKWMRLVLGALVPADCPALLKRRHNICAGVQWWPGQRGVCVGAAQGCSRSQAAGPQQHHHRAEGQPGWSPPAHKFDGQHTADLGHAAVCTSKQVRSMQWLGLSVTVGVYTVGV